MALLQQLEEFLVMMRSIDARFALIGDLALSAHQLPRATQDIDFLLEKSAADQVDAALIALGYCCIHRSEDAANYRRDTQALDLIYAYRTRALALLLNTQTRVLGAQTLPVISVEGLIGLKLQAISNDPRRLQDLVDIRNLIEKHRQSLDLTVLFDYFGLFDKTALYHELLGQ
jgi:Nucleotidyl transferase AbiEii toxin, Type IV TA system